MDYSALAHLDFNLGELPATLPEPLEPETPLVASTPSSDFDLDLGDFAAQDDQDMLPAPTSIFPSAKINAWDPRLILDLAIAVDDLDTILTRYALTRQHYDRLAITPAFRRELALTIREIRENGASFRQKAKIQAESYLEVLDDMVYSDTTPASVRLDAIKSTVAWGDLVPKEAKGEATNATQVNVNISF